MTQREVSNLRVTLCYHQPPKSFKFTMSFQKSTKTCGSYYYPHFEIKKGKQKPFTKLSYKIDLADYKSP